MKGHGLIFRSFFYMFQLLEQKKQDNTQFVLKASFLEIYNEKVKWICFTQNQFLVALSIVRVAVCVTVSKQKCCSHAIIRVLKFQNDLLYNISMIFILP